MKILKLTVLSSALLIFLALSPRGQAEDLPGFSLGGFYQYRAENEIGSDDLDFHCYGARMGFRDSRWINFFIDAGVEKMNLDLLDDDETGAFGLGATFWLIRQEYGYGPLDIGLFGSFHFADYSDVKVKDSEIEGIDKTDIKHYRWVAQGVIRGLMNENLNVFLRGGVQGTRLDPDDDIFPGDDEDAVTPAVNTGIEITFEQNLVLTVELNYCDSVGGGVYLDYWF